MHRFNEPGQRESQISNRFESRKRLVALILIGGTLISLGLLSSKALGVVFKHGPIALVILVSTVGLGLWIVRGLLFQGIEPRWRLMLAAAFGLGGLSLSMLGLGALGLLNQWAWIGILAFFGLIGLIRLRDFFTYAGRVEIDDGATSAAGDSTGRWPWLWTATIGFAAFAMLGATLPPGLEWYGEGRGYDVLEYHFGAPRDYLDAGRIAYLPHNIYSNFPLNVEMLYLLAMVVHGDPIDAVYTAKLLNAFLGMLAVAAIWLAGTEIGRRTAIIAGVLAATCPFIAYLCGVAYVENGLLFFGAMAGAAMLRVVRDQPHAAKWCLTAGLLAGLACGCKYTAVPSVVAPLAVMSMVVSSSWRTRLGRLFVFGTGVTLAFGPWLAKNFITTGNPVFPLAYDYFGASEGIWNDDGAARWADGHLPAPDDRPVAKRISRLGTHVMFSRFYGPLITLGVASGLVFLFLSMRTKLVAIGRPCVPTSPNDGLNHALRLCGIWIICILIWWTFFSHLADRFAVVLIIPCAIVTSIWVDRARQYAIRTAGALVVIGAAAFNAGTVFTWYTDPQFARLGENKSYLDRNWFGETDLMLYTAHHHRLNELLSVGKRILVVGDARRFYLKAGADYCVVFNRNPFAEAAARLDAAALVDWLRVQDYDYVYVDWIEMDRLRNSRYGFWESITRELFQALERVGLQVEDEWPPVSTLYRLGPQE